MKMIGTALYLVIVVLPVSFCAFFLFGTSLGIDEKLTTKRLGDTSFKYAVGFTMIFAFVWYLRSHPPLFPME